VSLNIISQPEFILKVAPDSQSVMAGNSTQYQVTIDTLHGFNETVHLSVPNVPEGIRASFSLNPIRAEEISVLTATTDLELASGSYRFMVAGSANLKTQTGPVILTVQGRENEVLPNPFTPNGDGFNDFVLFNYPEILADQRKILIFNFRGKKVRELVGVNRWDGKNDD